MAKEARLLDSFSDYNEYLEWKKDPEHTIIEDQRTIKETFIGESDLKECKHNYSFRHSLITGEYERESCTICGAYHKDYDEHFPPIDFTGMI